MTRSSVEGSTESYSAGCHLGGGTVSLGYDNNGKVMWSGVSGGIGKTLGAVKDIGETTIILGNK